MKFEMYECEPLILIHMIKDFSFFLKMKDNIKATYFQDDKYGKLFDTINLFYNKYKTFPQPKTLKTIFKKKYQNDETTSIKYIETIDFIYNFNDQYDSTFISESTINFVKSARVIDGIKQSIPLIDKGEFNQIYNIVKEAVAVSFDKDLGLSFKNNAIEVVKQKKSPKIPFGFNQIDSICDGGMDKEGSLCFFSGTYGIGKSILLQNVAINQMLLGLNICYISFELSEKMVAKRMIAKYTKISQNELLNKVSDVEQQFKYLQMITNSDIRIKYMSNGSTINHIRAYIEELKNINFSPNVLILDYLGCMGGVKEYTNSYFKIQEICKSVRAYSLEIGVPVITAAQISRDAIDKKKGGTNLQVNGSSISESFAINQECDFNAIVNQTAEEKSQCVFRLLIDKSRFGVSGICKSFGIDYDTMTVIENIELFK